MAMGLALAALFAMSAPGGGGDGNRSDGGADPATAEVAPPEQVQRGPEVSGSRSDVSPPLRDLKALPEPPGQRIHPWRRIPRPHATPPAEVPDAGSPQAPAPAGPAASPAHPAGPPTADPQGPGKRTRKKATKPPRAPRTKREGKPDAGTPDRTKP